MNLPNKTNEQLLRESINLLPPKTQAIIKAYATKFSLDYKKDNPLLWLNEAINWWGHLKTDFEKVGVTEDELADMIFTELRKQEIWNKLFNEDSILAKSL